MFSFFKKKEDEQTPSPIIVARIKTTEFLHAVNNIEGITEENIPITELLVGDLLLTYAIDAGENYIAISPSVLEKYNIDREDLLVEAKAHGVSILKDLEISTDDTVFQLSADENMSACSILFPALWEQIEDELESPVIVTFAHRDLVFYTKAGSKESIDALKEVQASIDFEETHALSQLFFQLIEGEWKVVSV